ncbi:MAG: hypothetical protein A3F98_00915 [Candidatus Yanofskybacteria bacterium RIFCSPLOWO2_12_FULL_41_8]|nr:MAG: hypothetical protein A3F98_00915 [Candidatus Yanofskybacteria bacterium RIFCSPLOWO2_12_FULL_41_8]
MTKKNLYLLMLVAGVALIAFSIFDKGKLDVADMENEDTTKVAATETEDADYLEGVLYASEDMSRGNLKLVSDGRNIYMRTSRDFSRLIGLQVLVFIEGALDNFELIDIQPKLEKNGYILQQ